MKNKLRECFGTTDIYLLDQILKGTFDSCQRILDAGCGNGRNLKYFFENGFDVYALDQDENAIQSVIALAKNIGLKLPGSNFTTRAIENMPYKDNYFDFVICNAVLHFASNLEQFEKILHSLWRVINTSGYLFIRLASDIGLEEKPISLGNGRYKLGDGSERFLVNMEMLLDYSSELSGKLVEPIKTTNVQNLRCMTTWILKKS